MTAHDDPLILIVEDDPEISSLMARYLGDNGFRVAVARDGEAMDRALAARRPELVVLDINLPGEDGLSLCLRLRNAGGPRRGAAADGSRRCGSAGTCRSCTGGRSPPRGPPGW